MATNAIADGDVNVGGNWDNGVPTAGNTFTINGFEMTVPSGYTLNSTGTISGSSTSNRGKITVEDGGEFQLSAKLTCGVYNELKVDGGGLLDLNGQDIEYTSVSTDRNLLTLVGTANNRARVISSVVGVGDIYYSASGTQVTGILNVQYCDFVDCGKISYGNNFNAMNLRIENATMTACDYYLFGGFHNTDADYVITNFDIRESRSTAQSIGEIRRTQAGAAFPGTGEYLISNITASQGGGTAFKFRTNIASIPLDEIVLDRLVHEEVNSSKDYVYSNLLMRTNGSNDSAVFSGSVGQLLNSYIFTDGDNPHTFAGTTPLLTGIIIQAIYDSYTDDGDHVAFNSTLDCTPTYCLVLEDRSGVFTNAIGTAKSGTYSVSNNTCVGNYDAAYGALFRTELGGTITGTLSLNKNMIVNKGVEANPFGIFIEGGILDTVTDMDNNAWVNFGSTTNIYKDVLSATKTAGVTAGYGGNDITDDPAMVDDTRNLQAYGSQIGTAQTEDAVIDYMRDGKNGYDATTKTQIPANKITETVLDLTTWVKAGYAPTDPAYELRDIGAVAWQAADTGDTKKLTYSKLTGVKLTYTKLTASKL